MTIGSILRVPLFTSPCPQIPIQSDRLQIPHLDFQGALVVPAASSDTYPSPTDCLSFPLHQQASISGHVLHNTWLWRVHPALY